MTNHHPDHDVATLLQQPQLDMAEVARRLEEMAQLLDLAATTVWAQLEVQRPRTAPHMRAALNSLGLGIHLAGSRARRLIPVQDYAASGRNDTDPQDTTPQDVDSGDSLGRSAMELLGRAAELSGPLRLWELDPDEGTQLTLELSDLIGEARGLGY